MPSNPSQSASLILNHALRTWSARPGGQAALLFLCRQLSSRRRSRLTEATPLSTDASDWTLDEVMTALKFMPNDLSFLVCRQLLTDLSLLVLPLDVCLGDKQDSRHKTPIDCSPGLEKTFLNVVNEADLAELEALTAHLSEVEQRLQQQKAVVHMLRQSRLQTLS
ncbi:hypothetical protein [Parvibium lacunae]|uniref:Uncharacterized protein n=1 Tax=Parvibium lacunae TaxID=1888893 RepID=A0A368L0H9_9BURK|nr:hypothetical protein [Parvibium lacunae]RCS56791.1 hypothetical protein DU000_10650 [Parvibium lacunae]